MLYNAAKVDRSKYEGTHVAMCYRNDGKLYWDYQSVKIALG
ncbi:hypothetical protein [uncultured Clostridium sp.]|nr:hypothetical protein [uncultured Clostridium sp.]